MVLLDILLGNLRSTILLPPVTREEGGVLLSSFARQRVRRCPLLPFALPASTAAAADEAGGSRHFLRTAVCVRQHRCRSLTPAAALLLLLRHSIAQCDDDDATTDVVSVTASEQTGQSRVRAEYSASSLALLCSAAPPRVL